MIKSRIDAVQEALAMTHDEISAGTPTVAMTRDEYVQFLEAEARARLGMTIGDFTQRYTAGELDDADPDVPLLAMWIGIGQNGHRVVA
jgi:hypothetical protein